jgi:uncharacterized repeat protein (TIGR02543 family)
MAYMEAIAQSTWRTGAKHIVVLITDAPTKYRPGVTVGGQPVTDAGAAALSAEQGNTIAIMTFGTSPKLASFATALGANEHLWTTKAQLEAELKASIIPASPPSYPCSAKIESITYASDNAPSTDVSASVTPASFTVAPDATETFNLSATAVAVPARYGDQTVVEIGFYVDGRRVASATQFVYFEVEPAALFTVKYDPNTTDKTSTVPPPASFAPASTVTVAAGITRAGYTFQGWSAKVNGTDVVFKPGDTFIMPQGDITLFAVWKADAVPPKTPDTGDSLIGANIVVLMMSSGAALTLVGRRRLH